MAEPIKVHDAINGEEDIFEDPIMNEIGANLNEILALMTPFLSDASQLPKQVADEILEIILQTEGLADGDPAGHSLATALQIEIDNFQLLAFTHGNPHRA